MARLVAGDPAHGLGAGEALLRLRRDGENRLAEGAPPSPLRQFVGQFGDVTVIALIVAAVVAVALGSRERAGDSFLHRFGDAIAIAIIVLLNAFTGFVQERKADRALRALGDLGVATARVIRDGKLTSVPTHLLVSGDLIDLREGDRVPADARLVETSDLVVNEAALTGESLPVDKLEVGVLDEDTPLAERANMVFLGTHVGRGSGRALVVATGPRTELGRIAELLGEVKSPETPLQQSLRRFGLLVVLGCTALGLLVFVVGTIRLGVSLGFALLTAVSLAVAAIPEGLPAVTTIVLALGVQRMAKNNALVRRLAAVETLGSADVICTDKTGTLTQNRMLARRALAGGVTYRVMRGAGGGVELRDADGIADRRIPALAELIRACHEAPAARFADDGGSPEGDPTDAALLRFHESFAALREEAEVIRVLPFDRERRLASVVVSTPGGVVGFTHGAPEAVLARVTATLDAGGHPHPLDARGRRELEAVVNDWARSGLRVIALARTPSGALALESASMLEREALLARAEQELELVGLLGLADPPRPEVATALSRARAAGVTTIMITGDHPLTAHAIAREIGILDGGKVVTGPELDAMDAAALARKVDEIRVVARATAANKLRLVKALRARGRVVAMTGDGVNDAPAIKAASIGVAMGRGGTDVTREAADMVLLDDNYATIVTAIEQGRIVYGNIKRFIVFLFAVNTGLVLAVLAAAFAGWPPILTPTQILWINLITNGLPALALGMEPVHLDPMKKRPRSRSEGLVSPSELGWLLSYGTLMAVLGIVTFAWFRRTDLALARTATFTLLALSPLFHALNSRSRADSVFALGLFSNARLWAAFAAAAVFQAIAVYVPGLNDVFSTKPLSAHALGFVLALSISVWVVGELEKALTRRLRRGAASPRTE